MDLFRVLLLNYIKINRKDSIFIDNFFLNDILKIKKWKIHRRRCFVKKLKIIIFLLMTISIALFGNPSFANEDVVTLDISQGRIKITPTGIQ